MIGNNESSPSVFTNSGERWLEKMIDALQQGQWDKSRELGHHDSWSSISYKHGQVPKTHPQFGKLIRPSEEPQYLLISTHENSRDVTEKNWPGSSLRDTHPSYYVENFGKVRIYNEAAARDVEHLFAPVTGWDGEDFRWVTMPVLSNVQQSDGGTRKADPIKKELKSEDPNWVIHDEEVGEYNGSRCLLDYGMCWYDGDWKVSESQLFD